MPIDFTNTNLLWTSVLAETLRRSGLKTAIICPGSRSAPLTIAFARLEGVEAIPVLDERSAAFFALGVARRTHTPVALVCTSGSAGANFYPAVIEACESRVPLLVLTADRPPELRHCNAGQAIDQQKLFGTFPNWYAELAIPSPSLRMLAYLRQTLRHAWERTQHPVPGVVHLNLPFREPLAPLPEPEVEGMAMDFPQEDFFSGVVPVNPPVANFPAIPGLEWRQSARGIVVAGPAQPADPERYCAAIAHLSRYLGFPVLAEGLSPLRNYASLNPHLISTYDSILRNSMLADKLAPDRVIRVGDMPTSKELRTWLEKTQPRQWVIDPHGRNLDPVHGHTQTVPLSVEQISASVPLEAAAPTPYLELWTSLEASIRQSVDRTLTDTDVLFEGKAAWLLPQVLPPDTSLFIASSMPVRDVEFFWKPGDRRIQPFFNRGTNGIDGTLSTAIGIAHRQQRSVLLTGDLAFLHDTNGLLLRNKLVGHLTIVLINNNGGGIFEMLPISRFDPPFEEFFATPQNVDIARLCAAYGVEYERIQTWEHFRKLLEALPDWGVRVLELQTDRKADAHWRKVHLPQFAQL